MALDTATTILALFVPVVLWLYTSHMSSNAFPTLRGKRVVLLIAHPDDEAMFFAPTVVALTHPDRGNHLKILCLSNGNAEGLGERRRVELVQSAEVLGVRKDDVLVLNDPYVFMLVWIILLSVIPSTMNVTFITNHPSSKLQDSGSPWPTEYISSLLISTFAPRLASTPQTSAPPATIDALITFDANGVSSHPNHISCYHGAVSFLNQLMSRHTGWDCPVSAYSLSSVNTVRKYIGVADAAVSVVRAMLGLIMLKDKEKPGLKGLGQGGRGGTKRTDDDNDGSKNDCPSWLLFVSGLQDWFKGQKAMVQCHKSQMVWFRWGWITIARYMIVNDLKRLKP